MKRNTKKRLARIDPSQALLIRRTSGLTAEIARVAGFDRSYVTRVLNGQKPPSKRFRDAIALAMSNVGTRLYARALEVVTAEHGRQS